MKLDITEIHFVKSSVENQTIKASDSRTVCGLLDKLDKEFVRLQKIQEKEQPSNGVMEAAK